MPTPVAVSRPPPLEMVIVQPAEPASGNPVLLSVTNIPDNPVHPAVTEIQWLENSIAKTVNAAIPHAIQGPGMPGLIRQVSQHLADGEVSPTVLDDCLTRAHRRDFCVALLEGIFKDGLPAAAVALAMNLAGTEALQKHTSSDMAVAAGYGAIVGSASVVLGHLLREWFVNARYTAWPAPCERAAGDACQSNWAPPTVATAPYLAAIVLPASARNVIRAAAACVLAGADRRDLAPGVDNIIESAGGVVANIATAVALATIRRRIGADAGGFLFLRKNVREQFAMLQGNNTAFVATLVKDSAVVGRRVLSNIPSALGALVTPAGLFQIAALVGGVMLTTVATEAIHDHMPGDPVAEEATKGAARTALLALTYAGLGLAAIHADKAARFMIRGVRNNGGATGPWPRLH